MKILKDSELNKELLDKGYVILRVFSKSDLMEIKSLYEKATLNMEVSYFNSVFFLPNENSTDEIDLSINKIFAEIFKNKLESNFENYKYFNASFIHKKRRKGNLHWHNDPSFYDQSKFPRPIAIWTTVEKSEENNGNLLVLPNSHKLSLNFTPLPIGIKDYENKYFDLSKIVKEKAVPIVLDPGEVLIHDQGLLHASSERTSFFKDRLAFKIILTPKNVKEYSISVYNEEKNTISNFIVDKKKLKLNVSKTIKNILLKSNKCRIDSEYSTNLNNEKFTENDIDKLMKQPITSLKSNPKFDMILTPINSNIKNYR